MSTATVSAEITVEQRAIIARFARESFLSLTTFKRDGTGVSTVVWFAANDSSLYVRTQQQTGKVKRLRRSPRATIAACSQGGKVTGPVYEAEAYLLSAEHAPEIEGLLSKKYGLLKTIFDFGFKVAALLRRRPVGTPAYLVITLR